MPINDIPTELKTEYIKDILELKNPSRNPEEYNIQDDFFPYIHKARESLVKLLKGIGEFPEPQRKLDDEVYVEFIVTGHASVLEAPGQEEGVKIIVGQSPIMLINGPEGTVKAKEQKGDKDSLVITSRLPRAMHHALLKYYLSNHDLEAELDRLAKQIQGEMRGNFGEIKPDTYKYLLELTLDHGIIPTPLLSSHYHGPRDLHPEKPFDEKGVERFLDSDLRKILYGERDRGEVKQIVEGLRILSLGGKDPFQAVVDGNGKILTENLLLYTQRVIYLLSLFSPPTYGGGGTIRLSR